MENMARTEVKTAQAFDTIPSTVKEASNIKEKRALEEE